MRTRPVSVLTPVRAVPRRHRAVDLAPLLPEQTLAALAGPTAAAHRRSGKPAPDMASWYSETMS